MKSILVTGCAGFIGSNISIRLLKEGYKVIGLDNNKDDYELKKYRLGKIKNNNFTFIENDINNNEELDKIVKKYNPQIVLNLAGCAGVRNSINNPDDYINSNIIGFYNILEVCKNNNIEHLLFASSSSVYGDNINIPYQEEDNTDYPVSLYAATKKCDEVLAYSYSKMFNMNITGLRFFTVYGPLGRSDMSYYIFTSKLINNQKIQLFNNGNLRRDFTYIDDIVEGIYRIIDNKPKNNYNIYNIGRGESVNIKDFVITLSNILIKEKLLPKDFDLETRIELCNMQPGDVLETYCDSSKLNKDYGFIPKISIEDGLVKYIKWYKEYYKGE